jgi:carbonic anhydrase
MGDATAILMQLREGNQRYVRVRGDDAPAAGPGRIPEHRPRAVVIGCSDARVPVEQVFDQPPGSLFVVRVAGHVLEPAALASILFAVRELRVRLVIVLGHQACGAVRAALAARADAALGPLVDPIVGRLWRAAGATLSEDDAIAVNVRAAADEVRRFLRTSLPHASPEVSVSCAVKALDTGEVSWLGEV